MSWIMQLCSINGGGQCPFLLYYLAYYTAILWFLLTEWFSFNLFAFPTFKSFPMFGNKLSDLNSFLKIKGKAFLTKQSRGRLRNEAGFPPTLFKIFVVFVYFLMLGGLVMKTGPDKNTFLLYIIHTRLLCTNWKNLC